MSLLPAISAADRRRAAKTMCPTIVRAGIEAVATSPGVREVATRVSTDNQAELLPRVLAERTRREIYSHCDRAPLGWETRLA